MSVGGSPESISIRGRLFGFTSDADPVMFLGGVKNTVEADGDDGGRKIQTKNPWTVTGGVVRISHSRGDLEFLQETAELLDFVPIVITYADGSDYSGDGTISGDLNASAQSATATLDVSGPGKLTRQ